MNNSVRSQKGKLISQSFQITKDTICLPVITVKQLPYYEGKPSGIFNEYDSGGFRLYHGIPKKPNPKQHNRLVEVLLTFQYASNLHRMKILRRAKQVIYHRHEEILDKLSDAHYVFTLRPSILFLSDIDFRIQFYAAMNLADGFKSTQDAQEIFEQETKYAFSAKAKQKLYNDFYMPHTPFDNQSWVDLNDICKINYQKDLKLNSILAKSLIFAELAYEYSGEKGKGSWVIVSDHNNAISVKMNRREYIEY